MKNKNLIYLALGLGALYFLTKKKDTETTETTTTTPDVGNNKNDVTETDTVSETESNGSATVETQGGPSDFTTFPTQGGSTTQGSSTFPNVFTTV